MLTRRDDCPRPGQGPARRNLGPVTDLNQALKQRYSPATRWTNFDFYFLCMSYMQFGVTFVSKTRADCWLRFSVPGSLLSSSRSATILATGCDEKSYQGPPAASR